MDILCGILFTGCTSYKLKKEDVETKNILQTKQHFDALKKDISKSVFYRREEHAILNLTACVLTVIILK